MARNYQSAEMIILCVFPQEITAGFCFYRSTSLFFTLVFPSLSSKWILFPHAAGKASLTSGWNMISGGWVGGFSAAAVDAGVWNRRQRCAVPVNQQC